MKNNKITDERVISQTRKIHSDAYAILVYCLFISILVQQFVFKAPFSQFAVEFFCEIGVCLYVIVRRIYVGIDIWGYDKPCSKKILIRSVAVGAVSTSVFSFLSGKNEPLTVIAFFISLSAAYFFAHLIMNNVTKKRIKQIDKMLNTDETDEVSE